MDSFRSLQYKVESLLLHNSCAPVKKKKKKNSDHLNHTFTYFKCIEMVWYNEAELIC